jgi:hypothetical protein
MVYCLSSDFNLRLFQWWTLLDSSHPSPTRSNIRRTRLFFNSESEFKAFEEEAEPNVCVSCNIGIEAPGRTR